VPDVTPADAWEPKRNRPPGATQTKPEFPTLRFVIAAQTTVAFGYRHCLRTGRGLSARRNPVQPCTLELSSWGRSRADSQHCRKYGSIRRKFT
jgi:hypothetical protein